MSVDLATSDDRLQGRQRRPLAVPNGDPIEKAYGQRNSHDWREAAGGVEAVLLLLRTHQLLLERIDAALRPIDLTFARYEILMVLGFTRGQGLSIRRLSDLLQVHSTSVTSAVDGLEDQGRARRTRNPVDRRSVLVVPTAVGAERAERATAALNDQVFSRLGLSDREVRQLWAVLRSFRQNAGDFVSMR